MPSDVPAVVGVDLVAEVSATKPDDLPGMFQRCWIGGVRCQWASAMILERVAREGLSGGVPVAEWVRGLDMPGLRHKSTVSRLLKAARWLYQLPAADRGKWEFVSPWEVYDVIELARVEGPDAAYEMATSDRTPAQKRQAVREKQDDQHHETSGLRTYSRRVSANTHAVLMQVENAVRSQLGRANPNEDDILSMLAADYLAGFVPQPIIDGEGSAVAPLLEDVLAGRVRCIECGAWWPVQRHHAIPRGHKIGRPDGQGRWHPDDPEWPCVYLCADHHRRVTENVEGTWRTHLLRWIGEQDKQWLAAKVEAFLGGRRLEEI